MKLTTTLPDGRLQVNKSAVIARLKQLRKEREYTDIPGLLPVSQNEVHDEAFELKRYIADSFINTSED